MQFIVLGVVLVLEKDTFIIKVELNENIFISLFLISMLDESFKDDTATFNKVTY